MLGGESTSSKRGPEAPMDIDRPSPSWTQPNNHNNSNAANNKPKPGPSPFANLVEEHQRRRMVVAKDSEKPKVSMKKLSLGNSGDSSPPKVRSPVNKNNTLAPHKSSLWESPNFPQLLIGYVQFGFNAALAGIFLYLLLTALQVIHRDVRLKVSEQLEKLAGEINKCTKLYNENRCHPGQRVPAMEASCAAWETGMRRDPTVVSLAPVYAAVLADILNGFIEPITWKALACVFGALFGTVFLSNYAFAAARHRYPVIHQIVERVDHQGLNQHHHHQQPHYQNVFNRRLLAPPPP